MPEYSGGVAIQATAEVLERFKADRNDGLAALVELANAEQAINDECDVFFVNVELQGDVGYFEFEDSCWLETIKRLAASGSNVGLYMHCSDEYGAQFFLAKNPQNEFFSFYAGGYEDDFEIEDGDVVTDHDLNKWLTIIPQSIKKAFPELIDIDY